MTWDRLGDGKTPTASMRAGGYNVATPHSFAGWTTFEVRHGTSAMRLEIQLAQANAKLDYLGNATFASAVDLDLGAGARNGVLLGVGALSLEGTGGANRLDGNRGANVISGEAGNDMLRGREGADALLGGDGNDTMRGDEGNDRLEGGAGADRLDGGRGNDVLVGGFGADVFAFDRSGSAIGSDSLRLKSDDVIRIDLEGALPAEVAWEAAHIARVADGFRVALGDGDAIHIVTALSLGAVTDALILI